MRLRRYIVLSLLVLFQSAAFAQNQEMDTLQGDSVQNKRARITVDSLAKNIPQAVAGEAASKGTPSLDKLFSAPKILVAIMLLVIGYISIRLVSRILEIFAERNARYRFLVKGFIPIVKIFGWIVLISIIIVGVFQPPAATILAFSASIGVAVGFASQDILKNIFGGITIILDRPFKVGDKIETAKYYGEVVEIGLRSTRLVTPDDSLVTVPNGELMNQSVSNSNSGESNCQVVAEIYLPVGIDTNLARTAAMEAIRISKYIYLNKPVTVLFAHEVIGQRTFLKMKAKAYVFDVREEFRFKSDMTELIIEALSKKGISI